MPDNLTDEAKQALSKSGFFVYDQYKDEFKELPFLDPYDQTVAVFIKDNGRMGLF
ncbi:unnamed protein product [Paramecium octaurelia]|uniref:Uncharacterized protein n=1 Tax=Paramecium octaurelia TaxID=43137 RepID=A0A8S1T150_PAROT|nr:unnamed protein product [Paramecium octaurelia]